MSETKAKTNVEEKPDTEEKAKAKTETKAKTKPGDELVDYMAPLLPGNKQKDIFCAVNGETCVVKRGVSVKIKRKFYEALQAAAAQQMAAYKTMSDIQKQGEKPAAEM